jgi:flagellar hook-length control protein FliK
MTQPLPLAQTGLSSQGVSLFGSARALETKWRLGNSELIPSAGAASSVAKSAGSKSNFAQTLRDKKQAASDTDLARERNPTPASESDDRSNVDSSQSHAKRTKKADEKAKSEDSKGDEASDAADSAETSKVSDSDNAQSTHEADESEDTSTGNHTGPTKPEDTKTDPGQTGAPQQNPIAAVAQATQPAPKKDPAPQGQSNPNAAADSTDKVTDKAPVHAAAPVGATGQGADKGDSNKGSADARPTDDVVNQGEAGGEAIDRKAMDPQADQNAARTELSAATDASAKTRAVPENTGIQPKPASADAAKRAKTSAAARADAQTASETPEPASKSGAQARADRKDAAQDAPPPQAITEPQAAPVQQTMPSVEPAAQTKAMEFKVGATSAQQKAASVEGAGGPVVTAEMQPGEQVVSTPQATPSAELLRALSPTTGATNVGSTPPQQATPQAAANPDYQRLLGQQVERGITQAIQQAAAATDAMITGTGSVVLRLHPANLGQLKVQIRFEGGGGSGVRARFEASSSRAKGILGDSIESLKTALEARGLRVDEVVVAQSPRMPEPDLGSFVPGAERHEGSGPGDAGTGFAGGNDQPAPSYGALASGDSRLGAAESGNDIPIGGLGERPVWLTGAAGWTVDANGNVRVDALV